MRSDTQTVTIEVPPGKVLAFVADGANLPRWAIGFARSVRQQEAGWIVETGQREVPTTIRCDEASGTVDFRMPMGPARDASAYARALPNGTGTEFVFTQLQSPGVPDEIFEQLVAAVSHELVALKALLEVACPL